MKYIRLGTKVTGAFWNEVTPTSGVIVVLISFQAAGKWRLKVTPEGGSELDDECDILINAMGVLKYASYCPFCVLDWLAVIGDFQIYRD